MRRARLFTKLAVASRRRYLGKLPTGVITFPRLSFLLALPNTPNEVKQEINAIRREISLVKKTWDLRDIFVLHGIAFEQNGAATIVSGPPSIGKSTFLRKIVDKKLVKPIDDGAILVGKNKNNEFIVIKTGLYEAEERISKLSKIPRIILHYQSPFLSENIGERQFRALSGLGNFLGRASFAVGREFVPSKKKTIFSPEAIPLNKIVLAHHPKDIALNVKVEESSIETLTSKQLEQVFAKKMFVTTPFKGKWANYVEKILKVG